MWLNTTDLQAGKDNESLLDYLCYFLASAKPVPKKTRQIEEVVSVQ